MNSVLSAESAVLLKLKSVGAVLLVLCSIIVSLLAFRASQCNLCLHNYHLKFITQIKPLLRGIDYSNIYFSSCQLFFTIFLKKFLLNIHIKTCPPYIVIIRCFLPNLLILKVRVWIT